MKTFITKEVSSETMGGRVSVTRFRTSSGFASITLSIKGVGKLTFTNEPAAEDGNGQGFDSKYEQAAISTARLLDQVASDACAIKEDTEE